MSCSVEVHCPDCGSDQIGRAGRSAHGEQRYRCADPDGSVTTFMLKYRYKAYEPGMKRQVVDMALNGSGVRDTARVPRSVKVWGNPHVKKKPIRRCG